MSSFHQRAHWQDSFRQEELNLRSGKRPLSYGQACSAPNYSVKQRQLSLNLVPQTPFLSVQSLNQKPDLPMPYLPKIEKWALKIGRCLVEVLLMQRPLPQLARWVSPIIYGKLRERLKNDREHGICSLSLKLKGNYAQLRSSQLKKPVAVQAHKIGNAAVYCQEIPRRFGEAKAVEVAMSIAIDERYRALAMRFESRERRWLLCAFEIA